MGGFFEDTVGQASHFTSEAHGLFGRDAVDAFLQKHHATRADAKQRTGAEALNRTVAASIFRTVVLGVINSYGCLTRANAPAAAAEFSLMTTRMPTVPDLLSAFSSPGDMLNAFALEVNTTFQRCVAEATKARNEQANFDRLLAFSAGGRGNPAAAPMRAYGGNKRPSENVGRLTNEEVDEIKNRRREGNSYIENCLRHAKFRLGLEDSDCRHPACPHVHADPPPGLVGKLARKK